jgi:integrase
VILNLTFLRGYAKTPSLELEVIGKRNKYRAVPLNVTARKVLEEYLPTLSPDTVFLFPSGKTKKALSDRALGYTVKKSLPRQPNSPMSALMICATVLVTGWLRQFDCIKLAQIMGDDLKYD